MSRYSSTHMRGSANDLLTRNDNKKTNRMSYSKDSEYRYSSGQAVPKGTPIRILNDGTVMTGHRPSKSSKILVKSRTNKIKKELNRDRRGITKISRQRPADVVTRKRTSTNNELDYGR